MVRSVLLAVILLAPSLAFAQFSPFGGGGSAGLPAAGGSMAQLTLSDATKALILSSDSKICLDDLATCAKYVFYNSSAGTIQFGDDITVGGVSSTAGVFSNEIRSYGVNALRLYSANAASGTNVEIDTNGAWTGPLLEVQNNNVNVFTVNASGGGAFKSDTSIYGALQADSGLSRLSFLSRASNAPGVDGFWFSNSGALSALDDRFLATWFRDNQTTAVANISAAGAWIPKPQALTIADNGGGTAAAATATPIGGRYRVTCSDANGCNLTLSETNAQDGVQISIINVSANVVNFADTSGVSETAGAFAAGQWDSITFEYVTDRWVEIARVNN